MCHHIYMGLYIYGSMVSANHDGMADEGSAVGSEDTTALARREASSPAYTSSTNESGLLLTLRRVVCRRI